jgi:hypothetical protein
MKLVFPSTLEVIRGIFCEKMNREYLWFHFGVQDDAVEVVGDDGSSSPMTVETNLNMVAALSLGASARMNSLIDLDSLRCVISYILARALYAEKGQGS